MLIRLVSALFRRTLTHKKLLFFAAIIDYILVLYTIDGQFNFTIISNYTIVLATNLIMIWFWNIETVSVGIFFGFLVTKFLNL